MVEHGASKLKIPLSRMHPLMSPSLRLRFGKTTIHDIEPLNIEVVQEWENDGVVTRYVTFTVGMFKGKESRIRGILLFACRESEASSFCVGTRRWPAGRPSTVESTLHDRGMHLLISTGSGVHLRTELISIRIGVTSTQRRVPVFMARLFRQGWKRSLLPDEYSIDPVPSPRNSNWFLLSVAARRGITFLEQQTRSQC